ncbi:hypothetical protein [Brevibacterium zhoupengii]|uniref:hypothetical protein n=1 Tax=Brevibacterium zhoupengii TaxID=2898795 RepID=UPI001F097EAA|nr:hypothetical protein [Brevibacterium zhoupengii]
MVTVKRAQPKTTSKYVAEVFTRMTAVQAQRLAEVQSMTPALPSRADAVRRLLDTLDDDDLGHADAAEGKEALSRDDVATIVTALEDRTRAYNELTKQVHAIAVNYNQLVKLGHQINLGATGTIPTEAVESTGRQLEKIQDRASVLAHQDAYVESVVTVCLPR